MSIASYLPVTTFALLSAITPGPNNILLMSQGANFGVKPSLPAVFGIICGFTLMFAVMGFGFSGVFNQFPSLQFWIKVIGTGYLLYLTWHVATSHSQIETKQQARPIGFIKGALLQIVNGKAWIVVMGVISAYTTMGANYNHQIMVITAIMFLTGLPSLLIWLMFGSMIKRFLTEKRHMKLFNYLMAGLLFLTVVPVIKEIAVELMGKV